MGEVRPLDPSSVRFQIDEDEDRAISEELKFRRSKYVQCFGCVTALVLILIVTLLVLGLTVFSVKEPRVRMNGVTIVNGTFSVKDVSNITLIADVSVKNPNAFTFKFGNATTTIYYNGTGIGEGRSPPGKAKARRTLRLNVTVDIITTKLLGIPGLRSDLSDQALNISSYTRMDGKVKIFNLVRRKVVVELNCTVEYNISTRSTQAQNCLRYVKI